MSQLFDYLQPGTRSIANSFDLHSSGKGEAMRNLMIFLVCNTFCLSLALAKDIPCETQAASKKLAGAALTNFVKKCEMSARSQVFSCEGQAATKKLSGAAKTSFLNRCYTGTGVPVPPNIQCEYMANERNLSGDAKNNFVKKCIKNPKSVAPKAK